MVTALQEFEYFKIIALNVKITCRIPINAFFGIWTQCRSRDRLTLANGICLARPRERVAFVFVINFITQDKTQLLEVNRTVSLGNNFREKQLHLLNTFGHQVLRLKVDKLNFSVF